MCKWKRIRKFKAFLGTGVQTLAKNHEKAQQSDVVIVCATGALVYNCTNRHNIISFHSQNLVTNLKKATLVMTD